MTSPIARPGSVPPPAPNPDPNVTAAHVAERAAQIVQEQGHCKGSLSNIDGSVCLWGALELATDQLEYSLYNGTVARALRRMFPDDASGFPGSQFNDLPDTTETDVAKVLLQLRDNLAMDPS